MKRPADSQAHQQIQPISKTIGANWNYYGLYTGDSLYSNYHAYLFDARHRIAQCKVSCDQWSNGYRYQKHPQNKRSERTMDLIKSLLSEFAYDSSMPNSGVDAHSEKGTKQLDSLQSLGESSGYESLRYRPEDDDNSSSSNALTLSAAASTNNDSTVGSQNGDGLDCNGVHKRKTEIWKVSNRHHDTVIDLDFSEDLFTQGTVTLGELDFLQGRHLDEILIHQMFSLQDPF